MIRWRPLTSSEVGSIPTCAGSRGGGAHRVARPGVHPRVRGEQIRDGPGRRDQSGSSPRARGAAGHGEPAPEPCGVIPACAGSSPRVPREPTEGRGHPRVRGEQRRLHRTAAVREGSSPRARGAAGPRGLVRARSGVIPACAGSRDHNTSVRSEVRGHPRVRGEQPPRACPDPGSEGSSPRARGAVQRIVKRPDFIRVIPACAGSSTLFAFRFRMRGGSSPRARGAGMLASRTRGTIGVIPACAGSSGAASGGYIIMRGHPRVRGEQPRKRRGWGIFWGSSPRARGAVFLTCNAIPADPPFLQVVEKQTKPTILNHPPDATPPPA